MGNVVLRAGKAGDIAPALAVWRAARSARRGGRLPSPEREKHIRGQVRKQGAFLVVADDAGVIVGMALAMQGLADDGAGPPLPGLCFISMVFVTPDRWGEGIGGRIIDAVLAEAWPRGYDRAQLWTHASNERARRLYERCGFRLTGNEQEYEHGERIVQYERHLQGRAAELLLADGDVRAHQPSASPCAPTIRSSIGSTRGRTVFVPIPSIADDTFHQLVRRIDARATLLRTWCLTGGVSAEITALEVGRADGQATKLIVRQHGEVDRAHNPHIARDEYRLLQIAQAHGLAAPKPIYLDESCESFPAPVLVVEYVEGETDFAPADLARYLPQLAAELVKIHGVKDGPDLSFLPRQGKGLGPRPAALDASLSEDLIRDALESAWPFAQANDSVLLHGDYWPGNILWRDGNLAAVVDWEDARIGDPLADLGNCRLELLWAFGPGAMDAFTQHYVSQTAVDPTNLPYWDLGAALRPCGKLASWGLDAATERRMRERHGWFVSRALETFPFR